MIRKKIKNNKGFTLLFAVLVATLVIAVGASVISIALKQIRLSSSGRESQFAFYAANTGLECALFWDLNIDPDEASETLYAFPTDSQISASKVYDAANYANIFCSTIGGETSKDGAKFNIYNGSASGESIPYDYISDFYGGTPGAWVSTTGASKCLSGTESCNGNSYRFIFPVSIEDRNIRDDFDIPDDTIQCVDVTVNKKEVQEIVGGQIEDYVLTRITAQGLNSCDPDSPRSIQRGLVLEYRS